MSAAAALLLLSIARWVTAKSAFVEGAGVSTHVQNLEAAQPHPSNHELTSHDKNAPAPAPVVGKAVSNGDDPSIYKPYVTYEAESGYLFFGVTGFAKGAHPPEMIPDPALSFAPFAFTSLAIARTKGGVYGSFTWAWFLVSASLEEGNRTLTSGYLTHAWSSNTKYCDGPDAPMPGTCLPAVFKWDSPSPGVEDVYMYDPSDLRNPILTVKGMYMLPYSTIPFPDTRLWAPPLSALRLLANDIFVPIVERNASDGSPEIVGHALLDADYGGLWGLAVYDTIEGPASAKFPGYIIPLGLALTESTTVRIGGIYISPLQQSFNSVNLE